MLSIQAFLTFIIHKVKMVGCCDIHVFDLCVHTVSTLGGGLSLWVCALKLTSNCTHLFTLDGFLWGRVSIRSKFC